MGSKADFYLGIIKPNWIGSIKEKGEPWNIPCKVLVQINETMYEEMVVDFLMENHAIIQSMGHPWPWDWEDSRMTDYSYFFDYSLNKVLAYSAEEKIIFNPMMIMQGESLNTSKTEIIPEFPRMRKLHGSNATQTI